MDALQDTAGSDQDYSAALTRLASDDPPMPAGLRTAGINADGRAVVDQYVPFDADPTFHRGVRVLFADEITSVDLGTKAQRLSLMLGRDFDVVVTGGSSPPLHYERLP